MGWIKNPITILVAGFAGSIIWLVVGLLFTLGDNDKYGKLSMPGEGTFELPAEEVVISYQERANLSDDDSLDVPDDLQVFVRSLETRQPLQLEGAGSLTSYKVNDLDGTSAFKVDIPKEGRYSVRASRPGPTAPDPAVTLGPGPDWVRVGAGSGIFLLAGFLGAGVSALLGGGRSKSKVLPATTPVPGRPSPRAPQAATAVSTAPPAAPAAVDTEADDPAEELRKLDSLKASGAVNQDEYDRLRADLLKRL